MKTGIPYPRWIRRRIRARRQTYPARAEPDLFSIVTPVFNTPPRYLNALARSVLAQDYPYFEWVVVDNGCTDSATRAALDRLAGDPRVRMARLWPNRGIMGGTRAAVEAARCRYLLLVDSDDLLYPDALRVMAAFLQNHGYPVVVYSDEDKVLADDFPCHPFFKPDWDPVLFLNCCFVAHLCAIDRKAALAVAAYTDEQATGCHDWDTFYRLIHAGHVPVHLPEILYSWRIHDGSMASPNHLQKPYTVECQLHVLRRQLERLNREDRIDIRNNPLLGGVGLWQPARRHVRVEGSSSFDLHLAPHPCENALSSANLQRRQALAECSYPLGDSQTSNPNRRLVCCLSQDAVPLTSDWAWEAIGLFELHPDAAVVGGRLFSTDGGILSAGEVFGLDDLMGCPDRQRTAADRGYYGQFICQRTVDAVAGEFFIAHPELLDQAKRELPENPSTALLAAWLGGLARETHRRVIYTPHIAAEYQGKARFGLQPGEAERWRQRFLGKLPPRNLYSQFFSRDSRHGHGLVRWRLPEEEQQRRGPFFRRKALYNTALTK